MAFTTHSSANSRKPAYGRIVRAARAAAAVLLFAVILLRPSEAAAENISITRQTATVTADGRLDISSRFHTELPDPLKQALKQGVPLYFTLNYQLSAPTMAAYKFKLGVYIYPSAPPAS